MWVGVQEALTSADALVYTGLDWTVEQKNVYTENDSLISGCKVNLRSTDNAALGIVSDRYKVVQNEDAFQFTDDLLSAGVTPHPCCLPEHPQPGFGQCQAHLDNQAH